MWRVIMKLLVTFDHLSLYIFYDVCTYLGMYTHTQTHIHTQKLHVTINDILVENVPEGPQLSLFYRGLALKLAQTLSIARSESMRLSMLKSFNDRQVSLPI